MSSWHWDVFCRVIDNHGDLGVCWRLSHDLARRGHRVRLWVDDPAALAWMAPGGHPGVAVHRWRDSELPTPADVVVEAFGCDPPAPFVAAMRQRERAPVWINLEYLSAEPYVERSHRLMSPVLSGPGAGLTKWFFYPGFTPATGGLLREPDIAGVQDASDGAALLEALGVERRPHERCVSVFCYPHAPLAALPKALDDAPTLLLLTPGAATAALAAAPLPRHVRAQALPWLSQRDYDRLLAVCDLNIVRGEDSFVRAQWAGRPFIWHIYPQHDGAHEAKLLAFLERMLADTPADLAHAIVRTQRVWNGLPTSAAGLGALGAMLAPWQRITTAWRSALLTQVDLTSQLVAFVAEKR